MKNNTIFFKPGNSAVRSIESYTEKLCENLFINDTYYGNLLMCLTDLNELLHSFSYTEEVSLSYETDFASLVITANISEKEINKRQQTDKSLNANTERFHLIKTLSDNLVVDKDEVRLEFNISALHRSVYNDRLQKLTAYFNKVLSTSNKP